MAQLVQTAVKALSRRWWIFLLAVAAVAASLSIRGATGMLSPDAEASTDRTTLPEQADLVVVTVREFGVDARLRSLPQWAAVGDSLATRLNAVPGIRAKVAAPSDRQASDFTVHGDVVKNGERVVLNVRIEGRREGVDWTSTYWRSVVVAPDLFDAMVSEIAAEIVRQRMLRQADAQSSEAK